MALPNGGEINPTDPKHYTYSRIVFWAWADQLFCKIRLFIYKLPIDSYNDVPLFITTCAHRKAWTSNK